MQRDSHLNAPVHLRQFPRLPLGSLSAEFMLTWYPRGVKVGPETLDSLPLISSNGHMRER